jgi:hypothetical protein
MPEDRRHTSSRRQLAAILFADIAGYTALMRSDKDNASPSLKGNIKERIHSDIKHKNTKMLPENCGYEIQSGKICIEIKYFINTKNTFFKFIN